MNHHHHRVRSAAALAAVGLLLAACSSPTSAPTASSTTSATVDVAALDTGPYKTTPHPPYGTAGDDRFAQSVMESQRLGEVTEGPWLVDRRLTGWITVINQRIVGPAPNVDFLENNAVLQKPLPEIAGRNGVMAGFSSLRMSAIGEASPPTYMGLQTLVLRFPDEATARTAAAQFADADHDPDQGATSRRSVELRNLPDTAATQWEMPGGVTVMHAFTPLGPFVLYQAGQSPAGEMMTAQTLVSSALQNQITLLKGFVPTPADKLPELPKDPSGFLLARTLVAPDGSIPAIVGAWNPKAWLHFEPDPLAMAAVFTDAGVEWVAQNLGTVYQTKNADTAASMLEKVVAQMRTTASAQPTDAVPGLPGARCFERAKGASEANEAASWQRVAWKFKCAAAVDNYVFTVYAGDAKDAMQRISAQWRILAGK